MNKFYIIIKGAASRSFLVCTLKRKVRKRNFNNWFEQILYSHQRSGFPLLFHLYSEKIGQKALTLSRPRWHKSPAQSKNILRFELHFRLCFGKADGADKRRLELLRGLRGSLPLSARPAWLASQTSISRIAFFRTFFSKKKVHRETAFEESHRTFL